MSDSVERRLRDLFDTVESQAAPGPMRATLDQHRTRAPRALLFARVALAAMAVGAAVVVALSWRHRDAEIDVATMPPTTIDGRVFDERVDGFCRALKVGRNGVEPRFATAEAYITVVEARREVIATFVDAVSGLARPGDAPDLPTSVVAKFRTVRELLDDVERSARTDRLDDAAAAWGQVDARIDAAIAPLGAHGAATCKGD